MRPPFIAGYVLAALFIATALAVGNYEFAVYAGVTALLLGMLHATDSRFAYPSLALWLFDLWMLLHVLGGMYPVGGGVLYSHVLIPLIGEPYLVLKYDQVVHAFCYFVIALLAWSVTSKIAAPGASFGLLAAMTVLAATGVGGLNEIVEFTTTIFFETNVGGYENTAIDLVMNLLGALLAVPVMRRWGMPPAAGAAGMQ